MIWTAIWEGLKTIAGPITEVVKGWQERKRIQAESEVKLQQAKTDAMIEYMKTQQAADIAWENLSIGNSGWKDEFWTLVLSIPGILCFIPGMADFVRDGFAALATCPEWYQWALLVAIASSFGYKKIADFMALKKGV
jgi:hypothetical protein